MSRRKVISYGVTIPFISPSKERTVPKSETYPFIPAVFNILIAHGRLSWKAFTLSHPCKRSLSEQKRRKVKKKLTFHFPFSFIVSTKTDSSPPSSFCHRVLTNTIGQLTVSSFIPAKRKGIRCKSSKALPIASGVTPSCCRSTSSTN